MIKMLKEKIKFFQHIPLFVNIVLIKKSTDITINRGLVKDIKIRETNLRFFFHPLNSNSRRHKNIMQQNDSGLISIPLFRSIKRRTTKAKAEVLFL
jgi:hypothetical protein